MVWNCSNQEMSVTHSTEQDMVMSHDQVTKRFKVTKKFHHDQVEYENK